MRTIPSSSDQAPARLRAAWLTGVSVLSLFVFPGCPVSHPPRTITSVALQLVASGLTSPLGMAVPDDGTNRLFVLDQIGLIRIIDANGNLLAPPFLDLRDRMVSVGIDFGGLIFDERGLLGLAFHPDYATNGRFFVFYTAPKGEDQPEEFDSETHVSEFHVSADDPNLGDPSSERILLTIGKPQFNHNGGQLAFGPDGYLYISVGDGGGAGDIDPGHTPNLGNGQDKSTVLGKVLRIDVDSGDPYGVPSDNPFVSDPNARHEIWAFGLRNPWRFSFDTGTGNRMFVGDAGQNLFEEVDIVDRGGNYGWNIREGAHCFDRANQGSPPAQCVSTGAGGEPLIDPIIEYPHPGAQGQPVGLAVIGGFVYRGTAIDGLQGSYVFGDFSTEFDAADGGLFAADEDASGNWQMRELTIAGTADGRIERFILGFGRGPDEELYVLTSKNVGPLGTTGEVYRIVAAP